MKKIRYKNKYGATAACTLRLGENVVSSDVSHSDTIYGDSWFASARTAIAVNNDLNCHFVGIVKTAHSRYPKAFLSKAMKEWPGGTHLVLESCFGKKNLIAVGYKYSAKKVNHFVLTRGAALTTRGDPYMSRFRSSRGNYRTREVHRPIAISNYFAVSGKIDVHNQIRQGELALEDLWITGDGWLRTVCTILGMATTNAFLACCYSFARECVYSQLTTKEFVGILCRQLVAYPFPDTATFGRNVQRSGQAPPQWFELLPGRFIPNSARPNQQALADVTNTNINEGETPTVGRTQLKPGWSQVSHEETVQKPVDAPWLPPDVTSYHKQIKIRAVEAPDGKRYRPPQCKMCKVYGLKQKKSPYLCIECGDFFCHDFEQGRTGSCPRQCFWTHMCTRVKASGISTEQWRRDFDRWNDERVARCKHSDGIQ
jgi:hypothetical protein